MVRCSRLGGGGAHLAVCMAWIRRSVSSRVPALSAPSPGLVRSESLLLEQVGTGAGGDEVAVLHHTLALVGSAERCVAEARSPAPVREHPCIAEDGHTALLGGDRRPLGEGLLDDLQGRIGQPVLRFGGRHAGNHDPRVVGNDHVRELVPDVEGRSAGGERQPGVGGGHHFVSGFQEQVHHGLDLLGEHEPEGARVLPGDQQHLALGLGQGRGRGQDQAGKGDQEPHDPSHVNLPVRGLTSFGFPWPGRLAPRRMGFTTPAEGRHFDGGALELKQSR